MNLLTDNYGLTTQALFVVAVFVIGMLFVVMILAAVVFVHHVWSDRERRQNRQRFEGAATLLAPYLVSLESDLDEAVDEARRQFGDRAVGLVLRRARFDLKGPVSARISDSLEEMGAVNALLKETKSRRDWKRVAAVRGLGECGGPASHEVMMELAMSDPISEVRRAAREGLLTEHDPEATQVAIQSFLADLPRRAGWRRSFYARLAAVSAGDLLHLITSEQLESNEEKLALEALGDAGAKGALPLAIVRCNARQPELRATGVRVVGKLGEESESNLVIRALGDDAWFVRAAAARSLEWMLGSRAIHLGDEGVAIESCSLLGNCLGDTSWWVRANAARALARSGQRGIDVLFTFAEGKDRYARDSALAALAMADLNREERKRLRAIIDRLRESAQHESDGSMGGPQLQGATT